jgi:hypothetical protein
MTPRLPALLFLCLAAAPAAALPDWGRRAFQAEPEYELRKDVTMGYPGMCAVLAYHRELAVPVLELPPNAAALTRKVMNERIAAQRQRLLLAQRSLDKIQSGAVKIVAAVNQCSYFWDKFEAFRTAVEAAGAAEAAASMDVRTSLGWSLRVEKRDDKTLEKELAGVEAAKGRYPGLCVPPAGDPEIYAPAAGAPPELRAVAAEVDEVGLVVAAALKSQREAYAELVERLDGRGCRELAESFDELRQAERGLYFEYRRDAVRDAAMKALKWRSAATGK